MISPIQHGLFDQNPALLAIGNDDLLGFALTADHGQLGLYFDGAGIGTLFFIATELMYGHDFNLAFIAQHQAGDLIGLGQTLLDGGFQIGFAGFAASG